MQALYEARQVRNRRRPGRRGLAPLEFILSLPLLLFVMALIVDLGNVSAWKVRGATAARQAIWRQRYPRYRNQDPQPVWWPANNPFQATMNVVNEPQPIFPTDQYAQYTVARGPQLASPNGSFALNVDLNHRLDMTRGSRRGTSYISVPLPLLPNLGPVTFNLAHPLLDGAWQFGTMPIPWGYNGNMTRRTLVLYPDDLTAQVPDLAQLFREAAMKMIQGRENPGLFPLDRDPTLNNRNFYPTVGGCTLDRAEVQNTLIRDLVNRIQGPQGGGRGGVPQNLAQAYLQYYQSLLPAPPAPAPPGVQEIIDQLNAFIASLN